MTIYHWFVLLGFFVFSANFLFQLFSLLNLKKYHDPSTARGSALIGIIYSFTSGMSPFKKESAYLHLPTYFAGITFHLGTFLSFVFLFFHFFNYQFKPPYVEMFGIFLVITALGGFSILIKRIVSKKLKKMSHPDDYASNLFVTTFQVLSIASLFFSNAVPYLFIFATILFLYLPFSKLRHSLYFFTSRIQVGSFLGKRGVWSSKEFKYEKK